MDTENNVEQVTSDVEQPTKEEQKVSLDAMIEEYSKKTREELVNDLQELIAKEDFEQMRSRVPLIKNAFNKI
mgnify:FL=1